MALKAKIEAIIYAAEEPITLEQISLLVKDIVLAEEAAGKVHADFITETEPTESAATPDADGASMVDAGEPSGPTPVNGDSGASNANDDAIAEPDERAEEAIAEIEKAASVVEEISEAATPPVEIATEAEPQANVTAPDQSAGKRLTPATAKTAVNGGSRKPANIEEARIKLRVRSVIEELIADYSSEERGMEIRQVAGGFRMATKPEHHDVVRAFARSLKPPVRLSLAALETLAVIAYKQPVTAPEITEIRGVESAGVLGTLLDRKLITTAGRKQVIGRPILYKTSKQFLLRFGLNALSELPSMEEFEKLAIDGQVELFTPPPQTAGADEPEPLASEETAPEESSAAVTIETPATSSLDAREQPSAAQTPEETESDAAPADSTENDTDHASE